MLEKLVYTQPGYLIRRAHQFSWGAFMEEAKSFNITPVQYAALVAIAQNPGIDATRISHLISFDRATIGNVLERLEKKGLLTRTSHTRDKRTKQTFLTAKGRQTIRAINRTTPRIAERILHRLDVKDRRTLTRLLSQLLGIGQFGRSVRNTIVDVPARRAAATAAVVRPIKSAKRWSAK